MTIPEKCAPALLSPASILSSKKSDHAPDASEDQWLNDFIQRLHCAIADIDRRK